jgi:anaerobic carbon-monoxide dehydrogenase catalytic subunit
VVGFSYETIRYLLGGSIRGSYYTLNDNIIGGRVRGVAGVVGCNNCRTMHDNAHLTMIKELLKNDVIVLTTGCSAMTAGKFGLLTPESAKEHCGPGLAEVCETVGIPPVLHMGSCVDNSRILMAATACVKAGGLGTDISDLPAAGAAPGVDEREGHQHRPLLRGLGGVHHVWGHLPHHRLRDPHRLPVQGSGGGAGRHVGLRARSGAGGQEDDRPYRQEAQALGIDKARERVLYDMAMRREMAEAAAAGEEH